MVDFNGARLEPLSARAAYLLVAAPRLYTYSVILSINFLFSWQDFSILYHPHPHPLFLDFEREGEGEGEGDYFWLRLGCSGVIRHH